MRSYLICPMLLLLGCTDTEPEGSIALKDPGDYRMILTRQRENHNLEGCREVILNSNVPGFQVDAKVEDCGWKELEELGEWTVVLAPADEDPRYDNGQSRLTLENAHPKGREMPLRVCVQVADVDPQAYRYDPQAPAPLPRIAVVYVTLIPPLNP